MSELDQLTIDLITGYTISIFKDSTISITNVSKHSTHGLGNVCVKYSQSQKSLMHFLNIESVIAVETPIWEKCGKIASRALINTIGRTRNEKS